MPLEMVACPHCGEKNSANKHVCYRCQQELKTVASDGVTKRQLRPRAAAPATEVVPQRPLRVVEQQQPVETPTQILPPITRRAETAKKPAAPAKPLAGSSPTVHASLKQRVQYYRQLQSLTHSGIPLGLALSYMEENIAYHLRPAARDMAQQVQGGNLLSEQMHKYPNLFPEWECSLVRASELSGNLSQAMGDIAQALEMEMELRQKVSSHTWHLKATAVVFIFVACIMANLGFAGEGGLEGAIAIIGHAGLQTILILGAGLLGLLGWKYWSKTRTGGGVAFKLSTMVPLIGPLMKNMMRIRFTRVLGGLWRAGVAPSEAIETAARASGSAGVIKNISANIAQIQSGGILSDLLEPTHMYPPEAMYLIRSGETSGSVPEALEKVAEYIQMDLESQVKTLPMKAQMLLYAIIVPAVLYVLIKGIGFYANLLDSIQ
ncbi:MAG: type II secretion system F family protein [Armatimonadota bacterium]